MTVVGLVAEGTNDFPIFEAFLEAELPAKFSRPVRIRHLQPEADATSGRYGGGGWGRVIGWCKANSGDNIDTYFSPIEEDDEPCDLILVQLDGDAMVGCADHSTCDAPAEPCTPAARVTALRDMTAEWLSLRANRIGQVRFAFPVMQSEAWLLAALRPDEEDWEASLDSKTPFRALRHGHGGTLASFYRAKAIEAAQNSAEIERQSKSFAAFRVGLRQ